MADKRAGFRGINDEVVKARTGKSSEQWYSILDRWGMKEKGHKAAARYLMEQYGVSPWWAQCITIRYEWERGFRTEAHRDVS